MGLVGHDFLSVLTNVGRKSSTASIPVNDNPQDTDVEDSSFGAEIVILVRDKQTRDDIQADMGETALVLTILDSKGMEFEDVILYDFFTTAPSGSDFGLLEGLLVGYYSVNLSQCCHAKTCSVRQVHHSAPKRPGGSRKIATWSVTYPP